MGRYLRILGDGQIWDVRGISTAAQSKTFEDLFSGRALGQMAFRYDQGCSPGKKIFSQFKEKGKITGFSVTKALLSNNKEAGEKAKAIIGSLAKNGALGIEVLVQGRGIKKNWTADKRDCWKGLNRVIIGGGVSEGLTGKILVNSIKKHLSERGFSKIGVYQAKFPGKEAGFLGAIINLFEKISLGVKKSTPEIIAGIGVDLGREDIGVGLSELNPRRGEILKKKRKYWLFKDSLKTPYRSYLRRFLDSRNDYSQKEREKGVSIRIDILNVITDLILRAQAEAVKQGIVCSEYIGVAVPGGISKDGYIINSTDYLPFFRKKDGFNFSAELELLLKNKGLLEAKVELINDGIAAGIANIYFGFPKNNYGKFAFLGVGSGLGGCIGIM